MREKSSLYRKYINIFPLYTMEKGRYVFEVQKEHGYGMYPNMFEPTEMKPTTGRYLVEFDGPNITIQCLSRPGRGDGGYVIYRHDTGHQKTWLQHHRELTKQDSNIALIYHTYGMIGVGAGGEIKIYKDRSMSITTFGSGRPVLSTIYGRLRPANETEQFYDYEEVKKREEEEMAPKAYNNSFMSYNQITSYD